MAVLPTVTAYRQAPRPTRGFASISPGAASAVADVVGDAGRAAQQIGLDIQDREATAAAKEGDTRVSEQYRKALYDPETGFTNLRGGVAVGQYGAINSRIDAIAARSLEGLSDRAKRKAKDSIDARAERAKQTVDTHTSGERSSWIDGASQARIGAAYQDALLNPAETAASLAVTEGELRGQAARSGWSAEKLAGEIAANRSKLYTDQASVIGETDPVKAMDYIRANRDAMLPTDIANVERTIGRQERQVVERFTGTPRGHPFLAFAGGFHEWTLCRGFRHVNWMCRKICLISTRCCDMSIPWTRHERAGCARGALENPVCPPDFRSLGGRGLGRGGLCRLEQILERLDRMQREEKPLWN